MTESHDRLEPRSPLPRLGWREWISLPQIVERRVKAKIDTGARSSSLHAEKIERFERDGADWVRFEVLPGQRSEEGRASAELPVHDVRDVKSSSGEVQTRVVVRATLELDDDVWDVDLTLSDREQMGFRLLIGREAIRSRYLVDPGASYLFGLPAELPPEEAEDADDEKDDAS